MHEFIHALGFNHEQTRGDRDDYVEIRWNNIDTSRFGPGVKMNFQKEKNSDTFGIPYDGLSIMHYEHFGFARRGTSTIVSKVLAPKFKYLNSKHGSFHF